MLSYIFERKVFSPSASWSELYAGIAGRCEDVMITSFSLSQRRCGYVSNETPNEALVERRPNSQQNVSTMS